MRTQQQVAASRENGSKSQTVPLPPKARPRIANANLQSGIFAETQVLVWEDFERLEARDRDAVVVGPESVSPVTRTPETKLQLLGSLRKNDSGGP